MDISRHRYFYDRIAENEMNDRNRDEIRRRMIPFPYIDSVMVRQNSDSVSGHDYIYNYVYSLPVTDGMKKLRGSHRPQHMAACRLGHAALHCGLA